MMKNTRLYTFAMLFADMLTPKRNLVYMKSCDKFASSDVKLSSRIIIHTIRNLQKRATMHLRHELHRSRFKANLSGGPSC